MKKQYKIQLPKGKKVTMTNVDFEDGVMTVNVELENRKEQKYEPKDGDFIFVESRLKPYVTKYSYIGIFHDIIKDDGFSTILLMYASLKDEGRLVCGNSIEPYINAEYIRPATEEEKKILIDQLAKVNKKWNEEKKCLEDVRWRAKEGDFVYVKAGYEHIAIFKEKVDEDMYVYANWNMSLSVSKIIIDDSRPLCCIQKLREIRPATEREKKILIDKLAEVGKRWNKWTKSIEDIEYIPQDGDIVTMPMVSDLANFLKAKKYIAIYKREDIEEEKIYCYYIISQQNNGEICIFNADHIVDNGRMISGIRPANEKEKKLLFDKLAEEGKRWNEEKKCLENVRWRAKDGEPYSYLLVGDTDILVTTTTDTRMYKDDERFNSGNYFKTDSDA